MSDAFYDSVIHGLGFFSLLLICYFVNANKLRHKASLQDKYLQNSQTKGFLLSHLTLLHLLTVFSKFWNICHQKNDPTRSTPSVTTLCCRANSPGLTPSPASYSRISLLEHFEYKNLVSRRDDEGQITTDRKNITKACISSVSPASFVLIYLFI